MDRVHQVMELLFQLAAYHYPDSITLPKDYQPPKMAISNAYWKAWQILVLLCAHNPSDFGAVAWENYPTLRAMMEMCITNQFQFPPPTLAIGEQVSQKTLSFFSFFFLFFSLFFEEKVVKNCRCVLYTLMLLTLATLDLGKKRGKTKYSYAHMW